MEIINISNVSTISKAVEVLSRGGTVIFPTETCYGIGVDAFNQEAVTRLLSYKQRPSGKAISIGVSSLEEAEKYVNINNTAKNIYLNFLPGPVTVVSESKHLTDQRLEAENGSLGVRIPNYKFLLDLISSYGRAITTTSANQSGKKTPYTVNDILENISEAQKNMIDLVIDAGELPHNPPSTVIDTTKEEVAVYRVGRIDPTKVKKVDTFVSRSVEDTIFLGEKIVNKYQNLLTGSSLPILLNGELGAGKTHMTKGIAKALNITSVIKSPTYNYVNEYKIETGKFFHMDAWRVQSKADLELLRFSDWFKQGNVIVIEWPSVVMNFNMNYFEKLTYFYVDFIFISDTEREIRIYKSN